MNNYRFLTRDEIDVLEKNACQAEDWTRVRVTEGFHPDYMHRVMLYGDIAIGAFDRQIEVSKGFYTRASTMPRSGTYRWETTA